MTLVSCLERIERSEAATKVAAPLQRLARPLARKPVVTDLLSGRFLGHPLHPFLVTAPIGCWTAASALDLTGRHPETARALVGAGLLAAVPTALSGAHDWTDTSGAEQRVGLAHGLLNVSATACYAGSWWARRRGGRAGAGLGWAGVVLASAAGWLGGHLSYGLGVGVDANAFDAGPQDWSRVEPGAVAAGEVVRGEAAGAGLALVGEGDQIRVLADRCSHRGGPLSDGKKVGSCLECPWHGSRFDLGTGRVRRGPASVPQPSYEVRGGDGGIEVRRLETRALRTNTVPA